MESDARARFVGQLKELRTLAGEPTLADLEKRNPAWLKQQTVSDLLAGKGVRPPQWERIAAFVTACVRIGKARSLKLPPEEVLLELWQHRYAILTVAHDQASSGPVPGNNGLDRASLDRLRRRHRGHFGSGGLGVQSAADRGDYFTGRTAALRELVSWLRSDTHDRRARVVVGDPGSGKSALLGRLFLLAEPDHPTRLRTAPELLPPAGLDIVALHAARDSLVHELAAVLGCADADRDELLRVLADRATPLTMIVDGLDEAGAAGDIRIGTRLAEDLLAPLTTLPSVRLIVGTRRPLLPALGRAVRVIDLDAPEYVAREDIATYAGDLLLDAQDPTSLSPYRERPDLASEIGAVIADRAGTSFLVARMTARALVAGQIDVDTDEPGWQSRLPSDAGQAFSAYLSRFADQQAKVERLLRPLAYAQGAGLPWSTVWAPLAGALSGVPCTNEDLRWLHEHAGAYIVEQLGTDGPVYRLFHETMAERLRIPHQDTESHRAITDALLNLVPVTETGRPDWTAVHPYLRDHLATHAAAGGRLEVLIADPDFLANANPNGLLMGLHTLTSDDARLTCAIYRASAGVHRKLDPRRRRQLLAIDAARFNAEPQRRSLAAGLEWVPRWATGQQTSRALHATLVGHDGAVTAVACTTIKGRPVAVTTGTDATVRVWDLVTGTPGATLAGHTGPVNAIACPGDRPVAVSGGEDRTVRVWDLTTGEHTVLSGHDGAVKAVACTELNGRPVAVTGGADTTVRMWDLDTGAVTVLTGPNRTVDAIVCTSINGWATAVTASTDGVLRVWDLVKRSFLGTVDDHGSAIALSCATVRGRPVVVSGTIDATVWDLATGRAHSILNGHESYVNAIACTTWQGTPTVVTVSDHGVVRVWDMTTGVLRAVLAGHQSWINAVACTMVDGRPVAVTAGDDRTARVWDLSLAADRQPAATPSHLGNITAVSHGVVDGRTFVISSGEDGIARAWDLRSGTPLMTFAGHDGVVGDVACAEVNGRATVVTASTDTTVGVWDVASGRRTGTLTGHRSSVHTVLCLDNHGRPLAVTASLDGSLRVWDLITGAHRHTLSGHTTSVQVLEWTTIAGSPIALAADHGGPVRVWNLDSGDLLGTLGSGDCVITAIASTTIDGQPVAVTTHRDSTIRVWNIGSSALRATLTGHDSVITAVACTTIEGQPVAVTTSHDRTVRVWDLVTNTQTAVLTGHTRFVYGVSCTAIDDRPVAITTGGDHTVRLWDLTSASQLAVFDLPSHLRGTLYVEDEQRLVVATGWDLLVLERTASQPASSP